MQVVDPLTLKITLKAPDSEFDRVIAKELCFVGCPTAITKEGAQFGLHPVGAGPFILTNWVHGSHSRWSATPTTGTRHSPTSTSLLSTLSRTIRSVSTPYVLGQDLVIGSGIQPRMVPQATQQGFKALEVDQPIGGEASSSTP